MNLKPAVFIAAFILSAYACQLKSKDVIAPTFKTPLTFSAQTTNSMTLSWAGTDEDEDTKDEELTYKVVYSLNDDISTEDDAEASGTILEDWTLNLLTTNMTSLSATTTYYVTILARDKSGNTGLSTGSSNTLCSGKIMFLATVPNGNFGGAAGADGACNAQKPAGFSAANFKAMLTDLTARRACYSAGNDNCSIIGSTGRIDWVFTASQTLCTSDYSKKVGTTSASALLLVPVTNTLTSSSIIVYTGFNSFWGHSGNNCGGFADAMSTSALGVANGTENGSTAHSFITNGIGSCNSAGAVYCVQQ